LVGEKMITRNIKREIAAVAAALTFQIRELAFLLGSSTLNGSFCIGVYRGFSMVPVAAINSKRKNYNTKIDLDQTRTYFTIHKSCIPK
jgi:hypothetical protein